MINGEMEVMIKQLYNRGIRVVREEQRLTFSRSIERMEEILEKDKREA